MADAKVVACFGVSLCGGLAEPVKGCCTVFLYISADIGTDPHLVLGFGNVQFGGSNVCTEYTSDSGLMPTFSIPTAMSH